MAPKCAMSALPPPCEQLKKSMQDVGAEVSLDGLRIYVVRHGNAWLMRLVWLILAALVGMTDMFVLAGLVDGPGWVWLRLLIWKVLLIWLI